MLGTGKPKPFLTGLLKTITAGLSAMIILLMFAFLWIATTEGGTHWLLRTVISEIEQLSVADIKGTLINDVALKHLHYQDSNNFHVAIANFKIQWHAAELIQGRLHIRTLQLTGINIKGQPTTAKNGAGSNEIPHIPLAISIDQLTVNQLNWLNGDSKTKIQQLVVSATLDNQILTVSRLALSMPQLQINAHSVLQLQAGWPLSADLDWTYIVNDARMTGQLNLSGNMDRFVIVSKINGAINANQTAIIRLSGKQPELNLQGNWQHAQWPLTGVEQISSDHGNFTVQGTIQQYQAKLNAEVSTPDSPNFSIAFVGNGNHNSLNIEQILIKPTQGQIKLTGQFSWAKELAFNLAVNARQLNPADLGANVPGKLDLKTHAKGSVAGDKITAELDIKKLTGKIYEQFLNADAKLRLSDQQLNIQQLNVSAGGNQLQAKGWLNEQQADLHINIAAPNLRSAWPTLAGSLNGNALIKGPLLKPFIKSNLQGHDIRYGEYRIGRLSLDASYDHASTRQSTVNFSATQLQLAEYKIERIIIQGRGNQAKHNIRLKLLSPLGKLNMNTNGRWNGKQWLVEVTQLAIEHPQIKHWQLQSPATLALSQSKQNVLFDLKKSCLIQANARLCLSAQGSPNKQMNGRLSLTDWPLTLTKAWLPNELALTGTLSVQAQLLSRNKDMSAKMDIAIADGLALFKDDNNVNHEIPFTDSTLQLQYQQDHLNSQLHLGLGNGDFITFEAKAGKADSEGIRQLSGTGQAKIANMSLIDVLLPEINQLQGVFVADLQFSGNTKKPAVTGFARWQNGRFKIPRLGGAFHNINLQVTSKTDNPERLIVTAEVKSGQGKLSAKGHLDLLAENHYPLQITLRGNKFQLSRLPEAEVIISPTLTINKYDNLTKINGLIKINSARIEIKTLPESAIAPSNDEIIISDKQPKVKKVDLSRLNIRIAIQFGDNTHFSGFGLETRLAGQVEYTVHQDNQSMHGHAIMHDASYRSYGQDLTLRKGEFLFNGPVDNPWLNIEAIRKATSDNITAVLNVSGPLKSPQTRIYTEPALPESEALAYLVTGKSMKNMSSSDSNAVAGAALSYGIGQLSWLTEQLGIDEFSLKQADNIKKSAVKLGHYLNPDLYIGVTMGLFSTTYAANIRYRLNKYFSIDTRAGETQRIGLKYHLETE